MSSTECPARGSSKSVLSRVSRKSVKQECPVKIVLSRVSSESFKQECLARVSSKSVKKECLQECPAKSVQQESAFKSALQDAAAP